MTDEVRLFSNSEASTFKDCRRRWYIAYYLALQWPGAELHGARRLGTKVHIALAEHYTPGGGRNPLEVFYELCVEDVNAAHAKQAALGDEYAGSEPPELKQILKDKDLGLIMIEGYLQWVAETGADEGLRMTVPERKVEVPLPDLPFILGAKLDAEFIREIDGARGFMDHKTAGDFSAVDTLVLDEQMLKYQLIKRLEDPDGAPVTSGLYNMLRKVKRTATAKPPFYMRVPAYHNDQELRSYYLRLHGILRDIMHVTSELNRGVDHHIVAYPRPTKDCGWKCPYFSVCPMMDDGSNVDMLLNTRFVKYDPYDRYAEKEKEER